MGKNRRGDKEYTENQTLKYENQKLRREISKLRKQLARIDLDRYSHVRDIVEEHYAKEEAEGTVQDMLKSMKEQWKCHSCEDGHLEIYDYPRGGEIYYYRICSNAPTCTNRTKAQKYDPGKVKGIKRDTNKPDKNDQSK